MANNNGRLGGGAGAGGNNQMNEHVEFTVKVRNSILGVYSAEGLRVDCFICQYSLLS
jgi:hypothetical protein